MNKSQRIYMGTGTTGNVGNDKYINVKLEQDIETLEFLTMSLSTEDAYQIFNADYGVLIGRVLANGGIGVPNAKISIFIPLTDADANDPDIFSVYPYKTPRDKNNEGKRYNLLPRVAQIEQSTQTYKPKQPFGSFPIKPELVTNAPFLKAYKNYYKYTALTNQYGDYMIFGVPIGSQTVHMSVDVTDIGKYSMTPASMIQLGYPASLFTQNATAIKPSDDLSDLPNIETQEIDVDIIPFWGDTTNFEIGISRQDFRIKANISSNFVIFGTTMTMGYKAAYGDPDKDRTNQGFYALVGTHGTDGVGNNWDIRVNRVSPPIIRVFTYTSDIPIDSNGNLIVPDNVNFDTQIREMSNSEYFEYNVNGQFLLNIPCNRRKITTGEDGQDVIVDDNSSFGVFTKFYGMMLIKYTDDLTIPADYNGSTFKGPNDPHPSRGYFKIPQSVGLHMDEHYPTSKPANQKDNFLWRKDFATFDGGQIYSVAQFLPMKTANRIYAEYDGNCENTFAGDQYFSCGAFFKTQGISEVTQQEPYDVQNYLINPTTGTTPQFQYNFSPNCTQYFAQPTNPTLTHFFGAQWLNLCLFFPQFTWAYDSGTNRSYSWADIFFYDLESADEHFVTDNKDKLFAGITNSKNILRGDAFQTAFINVPKLELSKLFDMPYKGINVTRWNNNNMESAFGTRLQLGLKKLNANPYKYRLIKSRSATPSYNTSGQEYNLFGWDSWDSTYILEPNQTNRSAYLFKGMYENDCIKMLSDFAVI